MSRSKPLPLWPFFKLGERLGREGLAKVLRPVYLTGWKLTPAGTPLRAAYARVRAHSGGRAPTPAESDAFLERLADVFIDAEATKFTLHAEAPAARLRRCELAALPEIERLRRAGRGVVLASPHFGNLPLVMTALAGRVPLTVVVVNAAPWRYMEDEAGVKVLGIGEAAPGVMRALVANECVLLLSDLEFTPSGPLAEFFGAPFRPPRGLCRMAEAAQAPILPVYAVSEGSRWRLEADAALAPEGKTAEELQAALLRSMEARIARHPEHWLVLRDVWDVERSDAMNRRQLELIALYQSIVG